jgi:tetratricopeptide (TPR) repeat protein
LRKKDTTDRGSATAVVWLLILSVIAALALGWRLWSGIYGVTPRFNYVLVSRNVEQQKILSGENLYLHPTDKIKVIEVSTNILFTLGVRLVSEDFDVNALRYEEKKLSDLLPGGRILDHYDFQVHVMHRNQKIGTLKWVIRPFSEDWLEKVDRTINRDMRLALLERAVKLIPEDSRIKRRLLDEYKGLKRWDKAALLLEELVGEKPDEAILFELLEIYTAKEDEKKIVSVLRRVLALDPNNAETRNQLAEILEKRGELKAAIQEYERVLEQIQDGDKLLMYKNLGYLYTKTGNPKMAIAYYLKAVDVDQGDPDLYYNLAYLHEKLDQNEKANFYLQNAVTLRSEDVESRLKLAERFIDKGKFRKAQKYLTEVLKREPKSKRALLLLMQIAEKQKDSNKLKTIYEKILSIDPDNETVMYNLGVLEYEAGNLIASLPHFRNYAISHGEDAEVHDILFDIYRRQNNETMALEEAQTLIRLRPEEEGPYHYLFEHLKDKGDYEKISAIMEKGLKTNPSQTAFREYLVLSYLQTGKEKLAVGQMEEILKVRPDDFKLWLHLAKLKEKLGDKAQALEAYKRVVEISPGHEEAEEAYLRLRLGGVKRNE